ncbi:MAG: acetyl esterase [Natronomonas sp.]|jgi:acetyl esterase|uniref:alpha/beta hydrolase fold domain-containing protein n=1 Tax=Natronomonas sp. TaxID=2184060 RepID=UPI00398A150D
MEQAGFREQQRARTDRCDSGVCIVSVSNCIGYGAPVVLPADARDEERPLTGQLLAYPITDHALDTDSYREHGDGRCSRGRSVVLGAVLFRRRPVQSTRCAAAGTTLEGVAPAVVVTAGHDPLHSEGEAYAERLAAAGVTVEHHHAPSLCHGFLSLSDRVPAAAGVFDAVAADTAALFE